MKKIILRIKIGIQGFVALSALPSGALMMIFPRGFIKEMPISMLEGSPFNDFFWPGLILFGIIGLGHAAALVLSLKRHRQFGQAAAVMGLGLMIWIFVQVNMIGGGHWLQYLYFALGVGEVSLAVLLLKE
ncbi:MAG: hypothetical protein GTO45_04000 [Candidatus Aminicenantes bacterium]|nr:hypothetical protein [Candidatus Aminicenantes bacterium]NIM77891.1 hypothetical protein [Candidatus Aminicenantes bacterium]NIN17204.1 hypothetical protein [Candidatus Aminicenantes bacterium]NIN41097.1 hypothetical protein [Candidatus Aminicenantes bacterium]NIN83902.1 hypothetical protein [Candidatus Aminicenantes bacterium]